LIFKYLLQVLVPLLFCLELFLPHFESLKRLLDIPYIPSYFFNSLFVLHPLPQILKRKTYRHHKLVPEFIDLIDPSQQRVNLSHKLSDRLFLLIHLLVHCWELLLEVELLNCHGAHQLVDHLPHFRFKAEPVKLLYLILM